MSLLNHHPPLNQNQFVSLPATTRSLTCTPQPANPDSTGLPSESGGHPFTSESDTISHLSDVDDFYLVQYHPLFFPQSVLSVNHLIPMSRLGGFDTARGPKGTLPGGIFAPLPGDQHNERTTVAARSSLKFQNATRPSPASNTQNSSRELNSFDDMVSSRPVPLTALSMRTNSRNKGSKNWKPFPLDDGRDDYMGYTENSLTFPGVSRPKIRSGLSLDYNESEMGGMSVSNGRLPHHEVQEQCPSVNPGVKDETKRRLWSRDVDAQIQQNPLSYSAGFDAPYQTGLHQQSRSPSRLDRPGYRAWPTGADGGLTVGRVQRDHSFIADNHVAPELPYRSHETGPYAANPYYGQMPQHYHYHTMDIQYGPSFQYGLGEPVYGQLAGYSPNLSSNTYSKPAKGVLGRTTPFVSHEPPSQTMTPAASHHSSHNTASSSTSAAAKSSSSDARSVEAEEAQKAEVARQKEVERKKKALRDAVLAKIEADEEIQRERIQGQILEQQRQQFAKQEQNPEPSSQQEAPVTSSHLSSNSANELASNIEPPSSGSSLDKTEQVKEKEGAQRNLSLKDTGPAKLNHNGQELRQKSEKKLDYGTRPIRPKFNNDTEESTKGSLNTRHAGHSLRPPKTNFAESTWHQFHQQLGIGRHSWGKLGLEPPVVSQSTSTATRRTLRTPPGLSKPTHLNHAAWSQILADDTLGNPRLKEANDWFHMDGRKDEQLRQQIATIADEYADKCEKLGGANYSKEDKEISRQMTLLLGNVIANLKSYIIDDGDGYDGQHDYFTNPRHQRFREDSASGSRDFH